MASETEGIALLSMYNDEEEDDDEEPQQEQQEEQPEQHEDDVGREPDENAPDVSVAPILDPVPSKTPPSFRSPSPLLSADEVTDSKSKTLRSPTPPPISLPQSQRSSPLMLTSPSPPPPLLPSQSSLKEPVDGQWTRRGALVIVDYAHDEAAMSPEPEEGEILSGSVVIGSEIQASNGYLDERTPPGTVQILTPGTQPEPPQPSDFPEQPKSETSMAIDSTGTEPAIAQAEVVAEESVEMQEDDPFKSFLPPPLTIKCPDELQEKINKFLAYKRAGKSFNADLRNRKDYRNPDFLQHAVRYQDIDQIGTCFSKDVFDPHGYDKSDYFDEIEAAMKREMERREQERKKSQKVDFVAGATQPGTVAPVLKLSTQISASSAAVTSGLQSVSTAVDAISREIRQNKKTKWDKIDGDVKNPLQSGGSDNLSAVGVHAAHLSAANAGTGYTAFAQQKRREAEERRSGERKFDKRS